MAIQYPKLTHTTLPSVDGFNGSLNILRDPPKSIFTKRIDKVGQNNDITNLIDDSGDRMNEGILVYSRGVNPMVAVSYDNNSNNAGSFTNKALGYGNTNSNQGHINGTFQAKLPYRVMDRGAFRPPIRSQRDLLPLSRQPRAWFQALSNPGFIDYNKKKYLPTKFRMIKDLLLKTETTITPNKSVKVEKPILENYKMQNAINEKHINIEGLSGKRSLDYSNFTRENVDLYKGIQENYEQVNATTNKQQNISQNLSNLRINESNYIGDKKYFESLTNPSSSRTQNLKDIEINKDNYIANKEYFESSTNRSLQTTHGLEGFTIDEDQYINEKEYYDFTANKGRDINVKSLNELQSNNKTSVKDILQYDLESGKKTGYTLLTSVPNIDLESHHLAHDVKASLNDPTVYKNVQHKNTIQLNDNLPRVNTANRNVTRIEDMDNFGYSSSRDYKLPETIRKGEFLNNGVKPTIDRSDIQFRSDPHKETIRKYVNNAQFSRFQH